MSTFKPYNHNNYIKFRRNSIHKVKHLKRAFSAPRICRVDDGHLARFVRLPAWEINRAPTTSPINEAKFGAMSFILVTRYSYSFFLYSERFITFWANIWTLIKSTADKSCPAKKFKKKKKLQVIMVQDKFITQQEFYPLMLFQLPQSLWPYLHLQVCLLKLE